MNEVDQPRPQRRLRRFSVRSLLIVITMLAVFFGYRANIARQEAPAIELVRRHGCTMLYSHDIFGSLPSFAPRPVREFIGQEYFGRIVRLNFVAGMPKSDAALARLDCLPGVTVINTQGSGITNVGLRQIANLTRLTCLRLPNAKITDDGLQHLSDLTDLNLLDLDGNGISDRGLPHLKNLRQLQILRLSDTAVTDEGIAGLSELGNLQYLNVQHTDVTQTGVDRLKERLPACQIEHDGGSAR